jgi:hypothetical protein
MASAFVAPVLKHDAAAWSRKNFGGAELGDARRTKDSNFLLSQWLSHLT